MIDDEEAVALAVGLQAATQVEGIAEASVRVLAKVVQVMARLRRQVDALRAMTVPTAWGVPEAGVAPAVLTVIALACRDDERLRFSYTAVAPGPTGTSNRTASSRWAAAGTSSPTTSTGTTGAVSGSTASRTRRSPAPGSVPATCPPPTPPSSSATA